MASKNIFEVLSDNEQDEDAPKFSENKPKN